MIRFGLTLVTGRHQRDMDESGVRLELIDEHVGYVCAIALRLT